MPVLEQEQISGNQKSGKARIRGWRYKPLFYMSMASLAIVIGLLFLALFEPGLPYSVITTMDHTSPDFIRTLGALTGSAAQNHSQARVFTNGEQYYPAELDAIRQAQHTICLEAYIFQKGRVTDEFIAAFTERARAGVRVNLLLDAIGSASFAESNLKEFKKAGGRIAWYHPLRWYTWPRLNNRTHRELLIIDGKAGFIGGAGWADQWRYDTSERRWRDTMVKLEGDSVTGLQATFGENWLEATGEILLGSNYYPFEPANDKAVALVVGSSPSPGRSTEARILFQLLLASSRKHIYITTPYFLPDRSIRGELVRAARKRGVDVRIITPGKKIDHGLTRSSSRRLWGELLEAGVKIYEYRPSMLHAKTLMVDGHWAVVGSTNMDSRSFGLNDEVNLALLDPDVVKRLEQDFAADLAQSAEITLEAWRSRSLFDRGHEWFGALLERQQ